MTANEDFKRAIRAGKIDEAFLVAMSNAPELSITTKIITAEGVDEEPQNNYLHTYINLIEGKIKNEISEKLTSDRYWQINQFHTQQVTQSHQTIQQNLVSLQKIFQLMTSFQQQASEHLSWVDIAADITRDSLSAKPDEVNASPDVRQGTVHPSQLYGSKVHNALEAATVNNKRDKSSLLLDADNNSPSPQTEDDDILQDLLSITESDEDLSDWSEWLEDDPQVETTVIDFESLMNEDSEIWQDWEAENQGLDEETMDEE